MDTNAKELREAELDRRNSESHEVTKSPARLKDWTRAGAEHIESPEDEERRDD